MAERVYLQIRNQEVRRLRFEERRKLEQILLIINRKFPDNPILGVSCLSRILRRRREPA